MQTLSKKSLISQDNGISCNNLHVCYGQHVAIEGLTGEFSSGTLTAIVGPNGGGKSSLLKVMNGSQQLSCGQLAISSKVRKRIAYLPQHTDIDRSFPISVKELVAMGLCHHQGFFKAIDRVAQQRIEQALESVGLQDSQNRPLHALSGGQLQRALFARMSVQAAPIILLDEPFAAIDAPTMEVLADILCMWEKEGRTLVVVLHDLDIVRQYFPTTLVLARQSVAWGKTKEVLTLENLRRAKNLSRGWVVSDCPSVGSDFKEALSLA